MGEFREIEPQIRGLENKADFKGQTSDGYEVQLSEMLYGGSSESSTTHVAFYGRRAKIERLSTEPPHYVRFHLVNLNLAAPGYKEINLSNHLVVRGQQLLIELDGIPLTICMVDRISKIIDNLKTTQGVDVTCEAIAIVDSLDNLSDFEDRISTLCSVLTFLYGNHIDWIGYDVLSEKDTIVHATYAHMFTSSFPKSSPGFSPFVWVAYDPQGQREFIESAYRRYNQVWDDWDILSAINLFTEVINQNIFPETKGLMLVSCMEMICARYLNRTGFKQILTKADFRRARKEFEKPLKEALEKQIPKDTEDENTNRDKHSRDDAIKLVMDNIQALNNYPFPLALQRMCKDSNFNVNEATITRFKNNRNYLVHRGVFSVPVGTEINLEKLTPQQFWDVYAPMVRERLREYEFMEEFVGRFIMSALGFSQNLTV